MATATLPQITGTEKQIAYAESIRTKALGEHYASIEQAKAKGADAAKIAVVEAKVAAMAAITDCRWWIDCGTSTRTTRLSLTDWSYLPVASGPLRGQYFWHDGNGNVQDSIPF